ncbi:hypothetical protein [Flavobacterium sp.]|uniref:hypothetical protein n=1 Tax=Flavobacterium sp. TaxID=239 RepID=UPI00260943C4|nr:hypothetical protein [Flavobacterium sp.]
MKKIIYSIPVIVFIYCIIYAVNKRCDMLKEIRENKAQTICKFIECQRRLKVKKSLIEYHVKDSLYITKYYNCPENYEDKINKFFVVDYSSKDPSKIIVDFSNEVTDTTAILKAGFLKEDL